jgi:hypothetical protein
MKMVCDPDSSITMDEPVEPESESLKLRQKRKYDKNQTDVRQEKL